MDIITHRHHVNRLEIVDTGRRRWFSKATKQRIVAESLLEPGLCASTARRYGISRSQLYEWRRLARAGKLGDIEATDAVEGFITTEPLVSKADPASNEGRIEIVASNGRRVIVGSDVDVDALLRILRGVETLRQSRFLRVKMCGCGLRRAIPTCDVGFHRCAAGAGGIETEPAGRQSFRFSRAQRIADKSDLE
jgi:transposase